AVLALPLWLIGGFGILVTLPLLLLYFVLDIHTRAMPYKPAFLNSKIMYNVAVILAGAACALGLQLVLSLDNLSGDHLNDRTSLFISVAAALPVTLGLLIVGNSSTITKSRS